MKNRRATIRAIALVGCCVALAVAFAETARGQISYDSRPRSGSSNLSYASPDPAPRRMVASEPVEMYMRAPDTNTRLSSRFERDLSRRSRFSEPAPGRGPLSARDRMARVESRVVPSRRPVEAETVAPGEPDPMSFPDSSAIPYYADQPPNGPYDAGYGGEMGGEMMDGPYPHDGWGDGGDDGCCDDGAGGTCGGCLGRFRHAYHCLHNKIKSCCLFDESVWQNLNEFGGVQAFKGPIDHGTNGNFGFHKGLNWASPLWDAMGIGFQLGGAIALSDFEGTNSPIGVHRDQYFVTTGFFRRAPCYHGLQGGAVIDYLHDNYYVDMDLLQIRSEISYLWNVHELGFWSAVHLRSDTQVAPAFLDQATVTWQSIDQFNGFYRQRFANGGNGRMWVGLTNKADVLFGSDALAPLSERWAIQASYNYLLPTSNSDTPKWMREGWNLSISLVWYPGYKVPNACFNPYRPLFTVADNGTLMIDQKQ